MKVVILVAIISLVSSYEIVESPILRDFGRRRAAQSWKRKRQLEAYNYPNSFERRNGIHNRRGDSDSEDEDYFVNVRTGETFMRRAWSAPQQTPGSDRFIINPMSFGGYPPVFNPFLPRPRPRPPPPIPKPTPGGAPGGPPPSSAPGPGPGWTKKPKPKPKPKKRPKPKPYEEPEDDCDCKNKGYSSSYSKPEKTTTTPAPEEKLCPCEKEKSYQETTKYTRNYDNDPHKDHSDSPIVNKLPCPLARLLYPTSEKKKCTLHQKPEPDPVQAHLEEYDHGQGHSDLVLPNKKKPCPYQSKSVLSESYSVPQNKIQTPKIMYTGGGTTGTGGGSAMTMQAQSSQNTPIIVIKQNPQHISPFGSLQHSTPQQQQRVVVQLPQNQGRALPQHSSSATVAYKLDLATNTITPIIQNVAPPPPIMPTVVNHGGISYILGGQSSLQQAQAQIRQPQQQFVIVNSPKQHQIQRQPIVIQQQPQMLSSTIFDSIPYRHHQSPSIFSKYNSQSQLPLEEDLDDFVKLPLPPLEHSSTQGIHPYEIVSLKRKKPKTFLPAPIYEPVIDDDKEYVLVDRDELQLQDKRSGTGTSNIPLNIPPPPEIVHISSHPKDEILSPKEQLPFPDNFFKLLLPESEAIRKKPEAIDEFSRIFQMNNDELLESDDGRSSTGNSLPSGLRRRRGKSTKSRSETGSSQASTEGKQVKLKIVNEDNNGAISYSGDGKKETTTNEENSKLNKEVRKGAELNDTIKADASVLIETSLNLDEGIDIEYYYEDEDDILSPSETKNVTKS